MLAEIFFKKILAKMLKKFCFFKGTKQAGPIEITGTVQKLKIAIKKPEAKKTD